MTENQLAMYGAIVVCVLIVGMLYSLGVYVWTAVLEIRKIYDDDES